MNKFFHLKTHSIGPSGGFGSAGPGTAGRSTSVGGRSGVGSLGGGSQGPGFGGGRGGGGKKSFSERVKSFILGDEEGRTGKAIGSFLGALSPVPFGATILGAAGGAIQKDIAAGGTATPEGLALGGTGGGRTTIEGAPGAAVATAVAPATASKELERARKVAAGGRAGTLLAGRAIAEEKQRKSLLGQ
jgi:hypothetical protein